MSSSYKGYYVITFLNVKFLKEILCDHVLVRQIPIMYVKFLCSQLDFPMGFLCIQKVLYCGFHCFIVRQNKSKQRIWNLTNMCPESLYICETEQIQNNEKSRNLYVSRKFPCTKSPNSWLSASSWTESKSIVAKNLTIFWSFVPLTGVPGTIAWCGKQCFERSENQFSTKLGRVKYHLNVCYPGERRALPQEDQACPKLTSPPSWQPES